MLRQFEKQKGREVWIDAVKGFGIVLMVIGHSGGSVLIRKWIYGFHMPLFFVIAGYLFDKEKWKEKGFAELIKCKAKAYLLPYIILLSINLVLNFVLEFIKYKGINRTLLKSTIFRVCGGICSYDTIMPNCAPLWFLTAIFVSCCFLYVLLISGNNVRKIVISVLYIILLKLICEMLNNFPVTQLPWHIDVALAGSVFMCIGNEFRKWHESQDRKNVRQLLVAIILFFICSVLIFVNDRIIMVINQYGNIWLFMLSASVLSLTVIYFGRLLGGKMELLAYWGRNSMIFLGFNYVINTVVRQACKIFSIHNNIFISLIDSVAVIIICSIISAGWNQVKKSVRKKDKHEWTVE